MKLSVLFGHTFTSVRFFIFTSFIFLSILTAYTPELYAAPVQKCGVNSFSATRRCGISRYQAANVSCHDGFRGQLQVEGQCVSPEILQQLARNFCNNPCNNPCEVRRLDDDFDRDGIANACDPELSWTLCTIDQVENGVESCAACGDQYFSPQEVCAILADHTSLKLSDSDGDGIPQTHPITGLPLDNCPEFANHDQTDINRNGIGDVCE